MRQPILCANLRAARKRLGLTQVALAKKLKTAQPVVCELEHGKFTPSIGRLQAIAKALGTTASALLSTGPQKEGRP